MMGFGFVFMLLVIGVPLIGIVALVIWLVNTNKLGNLFTTNQSVEKREPAEGQGEMRACSHCGTSLQNDWTHCPQCGAVLIERSGYRILRQRLVQGSCPECAQTIKGIWL